MYVCMYTLEVIKKSKKMLNWDSMEKDILLKFIKFILQIFENS